MPDAVRVTDNSSSVVAARGVPEFVRVQLFVRAAGRCEFDGCNENLLEHPTTLAAGNFAEMAHIVAFKPDGPRGMEGERPPEVNAVANLMLLCPTCHHLIDHQPTEFPRARLEGFKRDHEARIARVTEIGPDRKTAIVVLKTPIGGQAIAIPEDHIFNAVLPRYPISRAGTVIDLGALVGAPEIDFLELCRGHIDRQVERLFAEGGEAASATHLSVFGLAPIPLLVHLGARLSNKVPADVYQRHRDTEDWAWKTDGDAATYAVSLRREGDAGGPVALVLPLSGAIPTENLPEPLQSHGWIYEISLEGRTSDPTFLRQRGDLDRFRLAYQEALGRITEHHGILAVIDLIPAIPAPIAILVGRERLPKVHPALRVYDHDRTSGGYQFRFEVS